MPPRRRRIPRHETRGLALGEGPVRLAIVSDTHGRPHPDLLDHLRARGPDAIVHAGDVGTLDLLDALAAVAPVHAVRGNVDATSSGLPDTLHLRLARGADTVLDLLVVHIGLWQTRLQRAVREQARRLGVGLVICGHSHVPFLGRDGPLVVLNPGSCGPRRFTLPITFAMLEIGEAIDLFHVDCTTGARWSP